jgi:DNA primase
MDHEQVFEKDPGLLADFAEELAEVELSGRDLDRYRQALLDLAAERQDLDTVEIRRHLRQLTEEAAVDALLNRNLYRLWPFAEPGATVQDARDGVRHVLDLYRERSALHDTQEEGRRLAEAMDRESLARLEAKQKAVHDGPSRRVDFDRLGDAKDMWTRS